MAYFYNYTLRLRSDKASPYTYTKLRATNSSGSGAYNYGSASSYYTTETKWRMPTVQGDKFKSTRYACTRMRTTPNFSNSNWMYVKYNWYMKYLNYPAPFSLIYGNNPASKSFFDYNYGSGSVRIVGISQNKVNQAVTECLAKFSDGVIDIGVAVAESKEAASYLKNKAIFAARAVLLLKKGNIKGLKRLLKNPRLDKENLKKVPDSVAGRWLEYNYAIVPLLSDVKGAADLYNGKLSWSHIHTKRRTVKVTDSDTGQYSTSTRFTDTDVRKYRCSITAAVDDQSLQFMKMNGLINPVSIAWELVPFSFVVDWFLPIGTWLQALTATVGMTFIKGHVSMSSKTTRQMIPVSNDRYNLGHYAKGTVEQYIREPLNSFPVPLPYLKNPLSQSHVASGLALLYKLRK